MKLSLFIIMSLFIVSCDTAEKKVVDESPSVPSLENQAQIEEGVLKLEGNSDFQTAGELSSVKFNFNSNSLSDSDAQDLQRAADFLKANSNIHVQIEGHCDERGGIQYNLALGEKRAQAVMDYLVSLGVPSGNLSTISYGKEMPIAFGHDEASWAKNRRVNFRVIKL